MQAQSPDAQTVKGEQKKPRHMSQSGCNDVPSFDGLPPFRSLTELQTEFFQGHGAGVWDIIVKGVKEANAEVQLHKQTLRASASRKLLENFETEYFRSQQYEVNECHFKVAKELFVRASEECNRIKNDFWASEFTTSGGRIGYDPMLLAHVTELCIKERHALDRYNDLVEAMRNGLILKLN